MQSKTFRAASMKDAIAAVKTELGPDAVILSTRTVRSPRNLLGRPEIEITAAVDPNAPKEVKNADKPPAKADLKAPPATDTRDDALTELVRRLDALEQTGSDRLNRRIERLASQMDQLTQLVAGIVRAGDDSIVTGSARPVSTMNGYRDRLLVKGVKPSLVEELIGEAEDAVASDDAFDELGALVNAMMRRLRIADSFEKRPGQSVCALVGPTGVGKTTTLAKLAARAALDQRRKAALLTVDTFRVGAVEQLRTYGRIMNLPVEVAADETDLAEKIARHADKDVIFVDTAGVGQKDRMMLAKMASFFGEGRRIETHLIVSATTQYADLADVAAQFGVFSPASLIGSKLDETNALGPFFSLAAEVRQPLSWFTIGQNVPDDIEAATRERVVDLLLGITAH